MSSVIAGGQWKVEFWFRRVKQDRLQCRVVILVEYLHQNQLCDAAAFLQAELEPPLILNLFEG